MRLFALLLTIGSLTSSVNAQSATVVVPSWPAYCHKGYVKNIGGVDVWVGSVNININGAAYNSYCIQYNAYLYDGYTYTAPISAAPDLPKWRSISYILTWYHSSSISNDMGFAIQAAIWNYVPGTDPTGECYKSGSLAQQIFNTASGKNVVRPGDSLTLTPNNTAVPVGSSQIITARIVDASGSPKSGVKILFSTTFGFLDKTEGITDVNGEVKISITSSVAGIAEITASTKGMWAHILDMQRNGHHYQHIIGVGYPELVTKSTFVFVQFFVIPEVSLGTVTVILTSLVTAAVKSKIERHKQKGL